MALQKEIWIVTIIGLLFADSTFASRSVDHSEFVNNKTVHVPNAGANPAVSKTRPTGTISYAPGRTDVDLSYDIEKYFVGPVIIENPESVELSYNKRESVMAGLGAALRDVIYGELIYNWIPSSPSKLATTGNPAAATLEGATGTRNGLCKADVRTLRTAFDKQDIPLEGRCLLIDADMYGQLLGDLTETESAAFLATASAVSGIVGKLYGFDVYMRSKVAKTTAAGVAKQWSAAKAATDSAAGIAWSDTAVSRAVGNIDVLDNTRDAVQFGDVLSAVVRAGGKHMRNDGKGVILLYQGTPSA
jgi:hypothetical protein